MDELTAEEWESQSRVSFDSFLEPVADDFSSLLRLLESLNDENEHLLVSGPERESER